MSRIKWLALLLAVLVAVLISVWAGGHKPAGDGLTVELGHDLVVRFRNMGRDSVFILKPMDGSKECLHMPYYRFTVLDAAGQPLQLRRDRMCNHSGLWAQTKWPADYLVELKPGGSLEI